MTEPTTSTSNPSEEPDVFVPIRVRRATLDTLIRISGETSINLEILAPVLLVLGMRTFEQARFSEHLAREMTDNLNAQQTPKEKVN